MNEFDVAIVGGGMVGASFALALRATRLRVLLIEGVPDQPHSGFIKSLGEVRADNFSAQRLR